MQADLRLVHTLHFFFIFFWHKIRMMPWAALCGLCPHKPHLSGLRSRTVYAI